MQWFRDHQKARPVEFQRIPEWLPEVTCIGHFQSITPARDQSKDMSSLSIVWYQNEFGIDQSAVEYLRRIDWEHSAVDWEY